MRLDTSEIQIILGAFYEVFKSGKIYLFGSRTDDTKKGGDIDLYLDVELSKNNFNDKILFLEKLHELLGEQKIDVVLAKDETRLIEKEARNNMIELNIEKIKLEKYFHECDKHVQRIEEACEDMKGTLPITSKEYETLNKDIVQALDQYLFRFSKLQDTIGEKIFPLIISFYDDHVYTIPFKDLLNKLEKTGFIFSAKEWMHLRKIRNDISHQYDDEPEEMSQAINLIVDNKKILIDIYYNLKNKYESDLKVL